MGRRWRSDETVVKIKGQWASLSRAVEDGQTVDFLLTPQRERATAKAFLRRAIRQQGLSEQITID